MNELAPSFDAETSAYCAYVHIPFCATKCPFCYWVMDVPASELRSLDTVRGPYIDALCRQVPLLLRRLGKDRPRVAQIFWGGGTPSLLSGAEIGRVMATLDRHMDLSAVSQNALEVHPRAVNVGDAGAWRAVGINRLCLGVQSLVDDRLKAIGSPHRHQDVKRVVGHLRNAGFDNISLDLMFGFSGETVDEVDTSVQRFLALQPEAIQLYHFSARTGLPLRDRCDAGKSPYPDFEVTLRVLERLELRLTAAGYQRWLPTIWTREPRFRSGYIDHKFSLRSEVIGFGAGAKSMVDRQFWEYPRARLTEFVADPIGALKATPATGESSVMAGFANAMPHPEGLVYARWQRMFGEPFAVTVSRFPRLRSILGFFVEAGVLVERQDRLELEGGSRTVAALIELSYRTHLPHELREAAG